MGGRQWPGISLRSRTRPASSPDAFDAGFLVRILREHPEVELTEQPAHYTGGRVYVTFRVRQETASGGAGEWS